MVETKFTTSFIPKKPIQTATKGGVIKKGGMGFFSLITLIIFISSIVAYGGVFFYKVSREKVKESQVVELKEAKEIFDPEFVSRATRLNNRIVSVRELLNKHTSASQIFELFELRTLVTVRFNNMTFNSTDDGSIKVSASGIAKGFESIVLQSDAYVQSESLRDVIFSGLQPNAQGLVSFSFQGSVDKNVISYRNSIGASIDPAEEELQASDSKDFFIGNLEEL